jgi:hypothetical protein
LEQLGFMNEGLAGNIFLDGENHALIGAVVAAR